MKNDDGEPVKLTLRGLSSIQLKRSIKMTVVVLKDVEIWFPKLNPKRPNGRFDPKNPTWEVQGRTLSVDTAREEAIAEALALGETQENAEIIGEKAAAAARVYAKEQKKEWESNNITVKPVVPDEGEMFYRINLRKKSFKSDGEPATPPKLVDGNLDPVDPDHIGNGSVANIRLFQYDYINEGKAGVASILMGIQLTKHILYTPVIADDFEKTSTSVIPEKDKGEDDAPADSGDFEKTTTVKASSPSPSPSPVPGGPEDF
jgi:hypothetical protein